MDTEKINSEWSDVEIEAAVDAYIGMLSREQSGEEFVKAEENRILREGPLAGRTKGSVEFRMQNISAVLEELGLPRIGGYKPAKNVGGNVKDRIRARLVERNILSPNVLSRLTQGRCAWIFKYASGSPFESRWLSSHDRARAVPWEISRFQDSIIAGDLVFFWQASKHGGLRGWGVVHTGELYAIGDKKSSKNYRIGIREGYWLERPIQSDLIPSNEVISNDDILNSDHTNFRITPEQAFNLSSLFPKENRPNTDRLVEHTQRTLAPLLSGASQEPSIEVKQLQNEDSLETLFHSDDPWAVGLEDKIGVLDEARAMATLAIRTEDPPLAIGVLGDWGTGKSFFMRLIHQQIQETSTDTVLIRFNAWHFVDSNLWASLVDHIFTELDQWVRKIEIEGQSQYSSEKLFENLSTAQELAVEAAEKLALCRQAQSIATERLAEAQQNTNLFWKAVTQTLKTKKNWEKIQLAAKSLGLGDLSEDTIRLKQTIDDFNNERSRIKAVRDGLLHRIASWPVLILGLAIILFLPPAFSKAFDLISEAFKVNITTITKEILALTGMITGAISGIAFLTKHLRSAVNQIADFRVTLETVIGEQEKSNSKSLSKLAADVEEAQNLLTVATEKVAVATHEFDAGSGRGRMLRFIRERANDGHYASHLGLVAAIRKDFEELSRGLKSTPETLQEPILDGKLQKRILDLLNDPKGQLRSADKEKLKSMLSSSSVNEPQQFKRIVLFIDDLDRCPPEKVVEVLQAIHLLLGFPLFIVFVAADVRWVNRSLTKHYPDLLDNQPNENNNKTHGATAHDYLEKIFQIPYWVRPMSATASAALLESRIQRINTKTTSPTRPFATTESNITKQSHIDDDTTFYNNEAPLELPNIPNTNQETQNFSLRTSRLIFSDAERTFLSQLAPFAGNSPRRILRFINTYRIIKLSLSDEENEALEQRYFRELLLNLAINIGTPEAFKNWSYFLQHNSTTELRTLLDKINLEPWYYPASSSATLQGAIQTYLNTNASGTVQDTIEASKLVKRYSFIG